MALTKSPDNGPEPLLLGRVAGIFGVKGWVKLYSYTDPREAILNYRDCLLRKGGSWQTVRFKEGRRHGKSVIANFVGIGDPDAAAEIVGAEIAIRRDVLPETDGDEYYWADLEGLTVIHKDGQELGKVAYLLATGANDVLVVKGDKEILIPFVTGQYVQDVDLTEGVIRVDWEWE